jgi:hypothetical protein
MKTGLDGRSGWQSALESAGVDLRDVSHGRMLREVERSNQYKALDHRARNRQLIQAFA